MMVLDSIGLLFFLVPGVIAFAVDFSNGSIYLPSGGFASSNTGDLNVVKIDGDVMNKKIEQIILEKTGETVSLSVDCIFDQLSAPYFKFAEK